MFDKYEYEYHFDYILQILRVSKTGYVIIDYFTDINANVSIHSLRKTCNAIFIDAQQHESV